MTQEPNRAYKDKDRTTWVCSDRHAARTRHHLPPTQPFFSRVELRHDAVRHLALAEARRLNSKTGGASHTTTFQANGPYKIANLLANKYSRPVAPTGRRGPGGTVKAYRNKIHMVTTTSTGHEERASRPAHMTSHGAGHGRQQAMQAKILSDLAQGGALPGDRLQPLPGIFTKVAPSQAPSAAGRGGGMTLNKAGAGA